MLYRKGEVAKAVEHAIKVRPLLLIHHQSLIFHSAVWIPTHRVGFLQSIDVEQLAKARRSCAWGYQNEGEVGEGIRASGVPREELWLTSKLFEYHHHPEHVEMALNDTLKKLGTDYLDLYLMHWNVSTP